MVDGLKASPLVGSVRTFGLAAGVDVDFPSKGFRTMTRKHLLQDVLFKSCLEAGVMIRPYEDCFVLAPPLVISIDEVHELGRRLLHALQAAESALRRS